MGIITTLTPLISPTRVFSSLEFDNDFRPVNAGHDGSAPRPSVPTYALLVSIILRSNHCEGGGGANNRFWIMSCPALSSTIL
jgi:hypothetical protein